MKMLRAIPISLVLASCGTEEQNHESGLDMISPWTLPLESEGSVCDPGESSMEACLQEGVCSGAWARCIGGGRWGECNYPDDYETRETTCDGLDNDCDGQVDEGCRRGLGGEFPDILTPDLTPDWGDFDWEPPGEEEPSDGPSGRGFDFPDDGVPDIPEPEREWGLNLPEYIPGDPGEQNPDGYDDPSGDSPDSPGEVCNDIDGNCADEVDEPNDPGDDSPGGQDNPDEPRNDEDPQGPISEEPDPGFEEPGDPPDSTTGSEGDPEGPPEGEVTDQAEDPIDPDEQGCEDPCAEECKKEVKN